MTSSDKSPASVREAPRLGTVARLYIQSGYRRASTKPGPGEALTFRDDAQHIINGLFNAVQANQKTIANLAARIEQLVSATPAVQPAAQGMEAALRWIMHTADNAKEPCGTDPESPAAIRNSALAGIAGAAAQGLGLVRGPDLAASTPSPAAPTAPAAVEDEREAFEAEWSDNGRWPKAIERDAHGDYKLMATQSAWGAWDRGWRAALSTAAVTAAEVPLSNDEALDQIQHVFEHDEWREQAWEHGILMETNDNELAARVKAHANRYVAELIAAAPAQGKAAE